MNESAEICIIDYGAGNLKSIQNMLSYLSIDSIISNKTEDINGAQKLILPGVGHFDYGMNQLNESGLSEAIKKNVKSGTPLLGICLGAQLIGNGSEEGSVPGLSLIDFDVVKFDRTKIGSLKIPHMGWTDVKINKESNLFDPHEESPRFYFVHAFHFDLKDPQDVLTFSEYGYSFASAFEKGNIYGVQFHPEKSHKYGMRLFEKFSKIPT